MDQAKTILLPRYNANAVCPKCGNEDISTLFCNERRPAKFQECHCLYYHPDDHLAGRQHPALGHYTPILPHMHRRCKNCLYLWFETPLDVATSLGATHSQE